MASTSQKGFYVHQSAIYQVLGQFLSQKELLILYRAQQYADSSQFQNVESSFRHAMRSSIQTDEEARGLANEFVRAQFDRAWAAPTYSEALFEFGVALHTLQDSTSPVHGGFQLWAPPDNPFKLSLYYVGHVRHEMFDPGQGSELYRFTATAWRWFVERKLPEGDLFRFGADGVLLRNGVGPRRTQPMLDPPTPMRW